MVSFKLSIGDPKAKKVGQKEISESDSVALMGKHIGDGINGNDIGFAGYEFIITGGSDYCGFPMRKGVMGTRRKAILVSKSVGYKGKLRKLRKANKPRQKFGIRRRKSVCPDLITESITQINAKITKYGPEEIVLGKTVVEEKKK